ncbi:MAG: YkgJ family cysteine cluster protein [Promethearchaeota archaeon]
MLRKGYIDSYVPWRRVHDWRCVACGNCCTHFSVPLMGTEYAKFMKIFGDNIMDFNFNPGKVYLRKKLNNECIFQDIRYGISFCMIQELKPYVCKLFPFFITKTGEREALYIYKNEPYYVYVNTFCPQVKYGIPSFNFVKIVIPEAIQLSLNPRSGIINLTTKFHDFDYSFTHDFTKSLI